MQSNPEDEKEHRIGGVVVETIIIFMNDLRYAARMLAKTPGFTLVAVALLGAGIGANAVLFSALDAVVVRPLPVNHPEELVRMVQKTPSRGTSSSFTYPFYEALRDHSTTLAMVFGNGNCGSQ
jgi:putative ABC transport system permease protein